jgi:RNA polymerase sigma factor (sigma-70 family)
MTATTAMTQQQNDQVSQAVKENSRSLLRFIRRQVPDAATAEDLLQDVFYQLVATIRQQDIESAGAWLFQVARNKITDWYRKKKTTSLDAMVETQQQHDEENEPRMISKAMYQSTATPEEAYARATFWRMLDDGLAQLPEAQRAAFEMHELQGLSFEEMSRISGEGLNTLLSRKRYAVVFLRKHLRELYNELND